MEQRSKDLVRLVESKGVNLDIDGRRDDLDDASSGSCLGDSEGGQKYEKKEKKEEDASHPTPRGEADPVAAAPLPKGGEAERTKEDATPSRAVAAKDLVESGLEEGDTKIVVIP